MTEMIKMMCENYQMGFITSHEFLLQYSDILRSLGANKCVEDKMDELLEPFASAVAEMLMKGNPESNMIEHYGTAVFRSPSVR